MRERTLNQWLGDNYLPYDFFTIVGVNDCEENRRIVEDVLRQYDAYKLPTYMLEGVFNWLFHGIKPGNFLTGVIENDLLKAANFADFTNYSKIKDWVNFVYMTFPDETLDTSNWIGYEKLRKDEDDT